MEKSSARISLPCMRRDAADTIVHGAAVVGDAAHEVQELVETPILAVGLLDLKHAVAEDEQSGRRMRHRALLEGQAAVPSDGRPRRFETCNCPAAGFGPVSSNAGG